VRALPLGEAATHLPWLSPCAASLVALARPPAAGAWELLRYDPGAVLLLVGDSRATCPVPDLTSCSRLIHDPAVLDRAVQHLDSPSPWFVDWDQPAVRPVYQASLRYAHVAQELARRTGRADPDGAWVAGLLAPLGWLAVCAVDPGAVADCLADRRLVHEPGPVQRRVWGLEQGAVARRLVRQWRLPRWLAAVAGHIELPAEVTPPLGADQDLFRVVQLAVALSERQRPALHMSVGTPHAENAATLGLTPSDVADIERRADGWPETAPPTVVWERPDTHPLMRDLLLLARQNRRLAESPAMRDLENDLDHLQQVLRDQYATEATRLRTLKLAALAELAAGAGHEINNPLAVISGQAQYLMHHEPDVERQRALQAIVAQAQRIHQVLYELMQFARPSRPQKQLIDVTRLMDEVAAALGPLASQRRVQLTVHPPASALGVAADHRQARTALGCLVRNAVEAAPPEGWVRVRLEIPSPARIEWVVEDSGPGPVPEQREHLFDPFYSGRQAGRGRGLGLPTAWRLAREHGGEVRYEDLPGGPTRFVLSLPWDTVAVNGNGKELGQTARTADHQPHPAPGADPDPPLVVPAGSNA
jgi:signal transduction histidine kinase